VTVHISIVVLDNTFDIRKQIKIILVFDYDFFTLHFYITELRILLLEYPHLNITECFANIKLFPYILLKVPAYISLITLFIML
jgi:hypothetical protein